MRAGAVCAASVVARSPRDAGAPGIAAPTSRGSREDLNERPNRIVYSTILRHFGYTVTEALNGEEGIAKARSEKPDLILMDISIPIIDGWEATQVLKHDPATSSIPIIALTAHALASDREKAMEVGCDGYLAKPCEPRAVVAEVQRFLGRGDGD